MSSRARRPTTSDGTQPTLHYLRGRQATSPGYASLSTLFREVQCVQRRPQQPLPSLNLSHPLRERLDSSLTDQPYDIDTLPSVQGADTVEKAQTVLYLAYGSNLCDETFLGKRGIRPISQINVVVPELRLTFDLPGIPYIEPCFANTARRDPTKSAEIDIGKLGVHATTDYHKDRWKKGLVGVVYEVSLKDYVHIIATEGGGAGYHDIVVTCYPLPNSPTVPESPSTAPFKAHTLFAPASEPEPATEEGRWTRPDPSYAQPSKRYLQLITDGAMERNLPLEYRQYLSDIDAFTITSRKQHMGQIIFSGIWLPILTFLIQLAPRFQDDKGHSPEWLTHMVAIVFSGMWLSYDNFFRPVFGDGERTQDDSGTRARDEHHRQKRWPGWPGWREKHVSGYEEC